MDKHCEFVKWDGETLGTWADEIEGAAALINLAGKSVNCRYTSENKKLIMDSRINTTKVLGEAVAACKNPPEIWLNASGGSIYDNSKRVPNSEDGAMGSGFSAKVAQAWEKEFYAADIADQVRRVALRTTMVIEDEPGTVFDILRKLAKFGLGGQLGNGQQMVSWVHMDDYCSIVEWLIKNKELTGSVNVASPEPVTNAEMMRRFRKLAGMPIGLPAMRWMVEIGAFVMRTEAELIMDNLWVVPTKLDTEGYLFKQPEMKPWEWER